MIGADMGAMPGMRMDFDHNDMARQDQDDRRSDRTDRGERRDDRRPRRPRGESAEMRPDMSASMNPNIMPSLNRMVSPTTQQRAEPANDTPMDHSQGSSTPSRAGHTDHSGHSHGGAQVSGDGHGTSIDPAAHDAIIQTMNSSVPGGMPSVEQAIDNLDSVGAYNRGQPDHKKEIGAYLALNTLAKLEMMPPERMSGGEEEASQVYGDLKNAGLDGDAGQIRATLAENGGETHGLSDDQLVDAWGANEHEHLHPILFGNRDIAGAVHMTSLNSNDQGGRGEPGTLGGFNNKGEYPQWGWFENLNTFRDAMGAG